MKTYLVLITVLVLNGLLHCDEVDISTTDKNENEWRNTENQAVTKTITGNPNADKILKAFKETVIRGFLYYDQILPQLSKTAKPLLVAHPIGMASAWIFALLDVSGQQRSVWDEVRYKTSQMITERVGENNFAFLQSKKEDIKSKLQKSKLGKNEKFSKEDIRDIRSMAPDFFPQTYPPNDFTVRWPNELWQYLVSWLSGYIDLTNEDINAFGSNTKCKIAKELDKIRPAIIQACKKLAKARYSRLEMYDHDGAWLTLFGNPVTDAKLSYRDYADPPKDLTYDEVPLDQVKTRVINVIVAKTVQWLNENLVGRFNSLYNETWVPKECASDMVGPIKTQEIASVVVWKQSCMGSTRGYDNSKKDCTLPCGDYGTFRRDVTRPYCTWFPSHDITINDWIDPSVHISLNEAQSGTPPLRNKRVFSCERANWDECMPTDEFLLGANYSDEDYDKKKKKKKKEAKATKTN